MSLAAGPANRFNRIPLDRPRKVVSGWAESPSRSFWPSRRVAHSSRVAESRVTTRRISATPGGLDRRDDSDQGPPSPTSGDPGISRQPESGFPSRAPTRSRPARRGRRPERRAGSRRPTRASPVAAIPEVTAIPEVAAIPEVTAIPEFTAMPEFTFLFQVITSPSESFLFRVIASPSETFRPSRPSPHPTCPSPLPAAQHAGVNPSHVLCPVTLH